MTTAREFFLSQTSPQRGSPTKKIPEKTSLAVSKGRPIIKITQSRVVPLLKTRKGRASFKNLVIIKITRPKQKKRKIGTIFWEQTFRFVTPKGPKKI
jgi:hypothetical protein